MALQEPRYLAFKVRYKRRKENDVVDRWIVADTRDPDCPDDAINLANQENDDPPFYNSKMVDDWAMGFYRNKQDARIAARKLSVEDWNKRGIDARTDEQKVAAVQAQSDKQPVGWGSW